MLAGDAKASAGLPPDLVEGLRRMQRQLAEDSETTGLLRALVEKGLLKARNFRNNQNKLAYAYVLTPSGLRAKTNVTTDFLRRKQLEFVQLEREIAELRREVDSGSNSRLPKASAT